MKEKPPTIVQQVKRIKYSIEAFRKADSYVANKYVRYGTSCDPNVVSSYTKAAEAQYVSEHQLDILELAAQLAEKDLEEIKAL